MWFLIILGVVIMALGLALLWCVAIREDEDKDGKNKRAGFCLLCTIVIIIGAGFMGVGIQSGNPETDMPPKGVVSVVQSLDTNNTDYAFFTVAPFGKENTTERFLYRIGYTKIKDIKGIKVGVLITNLYGTIEIVSTPS